MIKTILFDLDGTVINSQKGITLSAQYALRAFGVEEPDPEKMTFFIGPPLEYTFMTHYGFDREKAAQAVEKYRERYHVKGIYECELYPGTKETLISLKEKGYRLGLASSKPEESCEVILKYHGIYDLFDDVCGAEMHGPRNDKKDVLLESMKRAGSTDPSEFMLVGDTVFDVNGAMSVNMPCIGVSFGFGDTESMMKAGACHICDSMKEVDEYFERK